MFQWKHEYKDYNGNKRNETFYFYFKKSELLEMEWRTPGGIESYMQRIIDTQDGQGLADIFKILIDKSYGVKGPDGREFIKSEEVLSHFKFTEAYSDLYIALATDSTFGAQFINGIFPKEAVEEVIKQKEMAEKAGLTADQVVGAPTNIVTMQQPQVVAPTVPMVEGQQVFTPQPTPVI